MATPATLGLAFLVYTPMAYLLLRAGYRRRLWAGATLVPLFAASSGLRDALAGLGGGSLLATTAISGWLAAVAAVGFRPLFRGERYAPLVTLGQLVVVGIVVQLLASVLFPLAPPELAATDPATLAVTFVAQTPPEELAITTGELHTGVLAVGIGVFLVGIGNAHVHGEFDGAQGESTPAHTRDLRRSS